MTTNKQKGFTLIKNRQSFKTIKEKEGKIDWSKKYNVLSSANISRRKKLSEYLTI